MTRFIIRCHGPKTPRGLATLYAPRDIRSRFDGPSSEPFGREALNAHNDNSAWPCVGLLIMNFEKLRYNEERPYTVFIDSELSVVSAAIKVCLVQLIAMHPPDLPSRLYASGSAKTNEEEASTGECSGRHECNPELFVTTTAGEDETPEGNPGKKWRCG